MKGPLTMAPEKPSNVSIQMLQQATGIPPPSAVTQPNDYLQHLRENFVLKPKVAGLWNYAGLAAGLLTLAATIVQIVKVYEMKSACAISYFFLIGNLFVQGLWLTYGLGNGYWVNILTGSIGVLIIAYILVLKYNYDGDESQCGQQSPPKVVDVKGAMETKQG